MDAAARRLLIVLVPGFFAGLVAWACGRAPDLPLVAITGVEPNYGFVGMSTPVRIEGMFHLRLASDLDQAIEDQEITVTVGGVALQQVVLHSESSLEGFVPGSLPVGNHDLVVRLADGREGSKAAAFAVEAPCASHGECADGNPCTTSERCINQRCNVGTADKDSDGDGFVDAACGGEDCDDDAQMCGANCFPGNLAADICDGHDQDCDAAIDENPEFTWFGDADGDGYTDNYSTQAACTDPDGSGAEWLSRSTAQDCDDNQSACGVGCFPGNLAADICDGYDQDCDGAIDENPEFTWFRDADGDGYTNNYNTQAACTDPDGSGGGWVGTPTAHDCDDQRPGRRCDD